MLLAGSPGLITLAEKEYTNHVYHQYTIRVEGDREIMRAKLQEKGNSTFVYSPVPVNKLPAIEWNSCPIAEQVAGQVYSLPICPKITEDVQLQAVCELGKY